MKKTQSANTPIFFPKGTIIEVIGIVASGKTTLAKRMSRASNLHYVDVDLYVQNPFLSFSLSRPEKYAFLTNLHFSFERSKKIKKIRTLLKNEPAVIDQGFDMGFHIYTKNHYIQKWIPYLEYQFLTELHNFFMKDAPKIHTTICLNPPVDRIYERIRKRGRDFEKLYSKKSLSQLKERLEEYKKMIIHNGARRNLIEYVSPGNIKIYGGNNSESQTFTNLLQSLLDPHF